MVPAPRVFQRPTPNAAVARLGERTVSHLMARRGSLAPTSRQDID
jgi:hypothetical protein